MPRNHVRDSFWAGWVAAVASTSLMQDFIGRDDYIRMARDHWVSGWITVPLAVVALVGAILYRTEHRRA